MKGQTVLVGIMIAVVVFIAAVSFISPIKDVVSDARSSLNCSSADISTGESASCIVNDFYLPIFFGVCLAVGLGYIGFKKLSGGV